MQKTKRMRAALFTLLLLPGIFSAGFAAASPRSDILAQQSRAEAMAIILEASARNPGAFDNATLASYQNTLGLFNDALLVRLAPGSSWRTSMLVPLCLLMWPGSLRWLTSFRPC